MKLFDYEFADERLLDEALTTPSYRIDHPAAADNQRLEFLGDAVLGLIAADALYAEHPTDREGKLTGLRARMVSAAALCRAAERHDFARHLKRNRNAAELPRDSKTIADAVEAVIGAAWLEGGLKAAQTVYAALALESDAGEETEVNPKGALQILAQKMKPPQVPVYALLSTAGKAHAPIFKIKAALDGVGEATAEASTRKAAEQLAAAELLAQLKARTANNRH